MEQFGLFPFIIFLASIGILIAIYIKWWFRGPNEDYYALLGLASFTLISITFSRSFHSNFIWFVISKTIIDYNKFKTSKN